MANTAHSAVTSCACSCTHNRLIYSSLLGCFCFPLLLSILFQSSSPLFWCLGCPSLAISISSRLLLMNVGCNYVASLVSFNYSGSHLIDQYSASWLLSNILMVHIVHVSVTNRWTTYRYIDVIYKYINFLVVTISVGLASACPKYYKYTRVAIFRYTIHSVIH